MQMFEDPDPPLYESASSNNIDHYHHAANFATMRTERTYVVREERTVEFPGMPGHFRPRNVQGAITGERCVKYTSTWVLRNGNCQGKS